MVTVIFSIGNDTHESVTSERIRNLRTSLMALRQQTLARDQFRIALVEQGVEPRIDASIRSLIDDYVFAYNPLHFNRSWGRNVGAVRAAPGVICTLDADIVVPPSFLLKGLLAWQCGATAIRPFSSVLYMDPESTDAVHEDVRQGREIDCESGRHRGGLHLNSKGGCIWTDRQLYLELRGHDERFEGWGNEDNEYWYRLAAHTKIVQFNGRLLHLYHDRPFEKTPDTRGNRMLYHALQHGLLGETPRAMGSLDRYRRPGDKRPNRAEQQAIASRIDRRHRHQRFQDAIAREAARTFARPTTTESAPRSTGLHTRGILAAIEGDMPTASACFVGALKELPLDVENTIALGRLLIRQRRWHTALSTLLRAVVMTPHAPEAYQELGRLLYRVGLFREATLAYQEALQLGLGDPQILGELGSVLRARGCLDQALAACEYAHKVDPTCPASTLRLGEVLLTRHEWRRAREILAQGLTAAEKPVAISPIATRSSSQEQFDHWSFEVFDCDDGPLRMSRQIRRQSTIHGSSPIDSRPARLHVGEGRALFALHRFEEAADSFRLALNLIPEYLEACRGLVLALTALGRHDEAVDAWRSLANALDLRDRFDEAIVCYGQSIHIKPDCLKALVELGRAHARRGNVSRAVECFRRALAIDVELPLPHADLGRALATLGQDDAARREFAWWCHPLQLQRRAFSQPLWDGVRLEGKTILVWADQELGDTIQWMRYVPALQQLGARVAVECQARLVPLVGAMPRLESVVSRDSPLPAFDVHVPLTLVPIVSQECRTSPCQVPYFRPDSARVDLWRTRLERHVSSGSLLTVGLCWAGHPDGINGAFRFAPLEVFATLAGLRGVRFVSLQMGPQSGELVGTPAGLHIEHLQDDTCSASDTAALMESLDLIITVDTMVAHLAGALGRPVWLLLPYTADWRWGQHTVHTPLYPSMTLFRQTSTGDWKTLLTRVRHALVDRTTRSHETGET